jgi:transposase-like protein
MMARKAKNEPYHQMMKSRATALFCPYEDCVDYKIKGIGNIIFIRKYGSGETQNLFKCTSCRRTFSERRGTPLFECHLSEEKVYLILKCLGEGNGIRATSRIVGVSKDTVGSIISRIGDHIEDVAETLMTDYHLEECQIDELWGYIFKKKRI